MKVAKWQVQVIEFICPECDEFISEEKSGSHGFMVYDIPEKLVCDCCGQELKVPSAALKFKPN
ncbi:MAG: hypothetical protein ACXWQE_00225 [Bdellovibrionales bacterium]